MTTTDQPTTWDEASFAQRKDEVLAQLEANGVALPQAWSMGPAQCAPRDGQSVTMTVHFLQRAINTSIGLDGENINAGSFAHIYDVLGDGFINGGVMATQEQMADLAARFSWVGRDAEAHINVDVFDRLFSLFDNEDDEFGRSVHPAFVAIPDLLAPLASMMDSMLRDYLFSMGVTHPEVIDCGWTSRFPLRETLVYTQFGVFLPEMMDDVFFDTACIGFPVQVFYVDKAPWMGNHLVPPQVRFTDASSNRLGSYLTPGTTIMGAAGFANIETEVSGMHEGRQSGRVRGGVGAEDLPEELRLANDVGGGFAFIGSMSGGNKTVVSYGCGNLFSSNGGLSFPLGHGNYVAPGHYAHGPEPARLVGGRDAWGDHPIFKALADGEHLFQPNGPDEVWVKHQAALTGISGCTFRRSAIDGACEVLIGVPEQVREALDATLHVHN